MRVENVEIYSDETNRAVMRHPGRRFPGLLVQGDTLYSLWMRADAACVEVEPDGELDGLRNALWELLTHYKNVLGEHEIPLPFSERP